MSSGQIDGLCSTRRGRRHAQHLTHRIRPLQCMSARQKHQHTRCQSVRCCPAAASRTHAATCVSQHCRGLQLLLRHDEMPTVRVLAFHPVLQADLTDLTSLPATLVGISAIIDCATARPEESTQKVDWEGKVGLIQCAQVSMELEGNEAELQSFVTGLAADVLRQLWVRRHHRDAYCARPVHPSSCTQPRSFVSQQQKCGAVSMAGSSAVFLACIAALCDPCVHLMVHSLHSRRKELPVIHLKPVTFVHLQAMGIKRYIFMSIFNCNKHPEVPLMNIKAATEEYLAASGLDYTVLRLCGFHQVCISTVWQLVGGFWIYSLCPYVATAMLDEEYLAY
eukprot:GHUV01030452.1.p1 GENE.GHUV01030452.1~~GHUV01030452.1.p1  ORF type:complete len:336 (-),score=62.35 GHUV01030452.1:58-1065(-)